MPSTRRSSPHTRLRSRRRRRLRSRSGPPPARETWIRSSLPTRPGWSGASTAAALGDRVPRERTRAEPPPTRRARARSAPTARSLSSSAELTRRARPRLDEATVAAAARAHPPRALDLGVHLAAEEEGEAREPEPRERDDDRRERAPGLVVGREQARVDGEPAGCREPGERGNERARASRTSSCGARRRARSSGAPRTPPAGRATSSGHCTIPTTASRARPRCRAPRRPSSRANGPKTSRTPTSATADCEDAATRASATRRLRPKLRPSVAVVGGVERGHVHVMALVDAQSASAKPDDDERDAGRRSSLEPGEAVAEELRRLGRHERPEAVHQVADRLGAREEREQAECDEQDRRNREEGAVGEGRRDHRDLVVDRLLARPDEDRAPVAPRQVGQSRVAELRLRELGERGGRGRDRPCSAHREGYPGL